MQLLLIRHAESENNALMAAGRIDERVPDPSISALGQRQAQALADWAASDRSNLPKIDRIYTSLMIRTIQTAKPLADTLDLPMEARTDTFERGGVFSGPMDAPVPHPGSPRSQLQAVTDRVELPQEATEDGWFPGSFENQAAGMRRALNLAKWLRAFPADATIALVAHAEIIAMLLAALINPEQVERAIEQAKSEDTAWRKLGQFFAIENTSTTMLELDDQGLTKIKWINRIDHLVLAGLDGWGASSEDTAAA